MSSQAPTAVISAAAIRIPRVRSLSGRNSEPGDNRPGEDGQPAEQRGRLAGQAALLHGVDGADAPSRARDERRQERRDREGHDAGVERIVLHRAERIAGAAAREGTTP